MNPTSTLVVGRGSPSALRRPGSTVVGLATGVGSALALGFLAVVASPSQLAIIVPVLATVAVFVWFMSALRQRTRSHLLGEMGFLYLSFALAYTVLPALGFLALDFLFPPLLGGSTSIALNPTPWELGLHFWRHWLFFVFVAVGYLLGRGRVRAQVGGAEGPPFGGPVTGVVWPLLVAICMVGVLLMSAPVETYYDHYTRFDHLGFVPRRLVYLMLTLKTGGYLVLLTVLVTRPKWRFLLGPALLVIATYETVYSFGARIDAFIPVMTGLLLYHLYVRPFPMRTAGTVLVVLAVTFSVLGVLRQARYNPADAQRLLLGETGAQLIEFSATYATSFHLYQERDQGTLPPRPAGMAVYELILVTPFVEKMTTHPQYWYQRNYFPDVRTPGYTLGVIADSALWGGEIDLALRALVNGLLFGLIARWFFRGGRGPFKLSLYAYLCATTIMTLKYSVFYQIVLLARSWLPAFALAWVLSRFFTHRHLGTYGSRAGVDAVAEG